MKTKEEVIKEAWGEYYNHGVGIDENGWLSENYLTNDQCKLFNTYEIVEYINALGYRPKSLHGIEDNNGWIRIESEKDLPKEDCKLLVYPSYEGKFFIFHYINDELSRKEIMNNHTHYQPIVKPEKPLY